jgi:hypothetical protein
VHDVTPLSALLGGALIGLSASLVLLTHGTIAGVSGLLGGALARGTPDRGVRLWFLAGLAAAGLGLARLAPSAFGAGGATPAWAVAAAGLLVGYGTRLGNGCTSGHGICGLSRLSPRSLAATLTFVLAGAATVFVTRHVVPLVGGAR